MLKKINLKFKKILIWRIKSIYHLWFIYNLFTSLDINKYTLVKEDPKFPLIKFGSDFDIYTIDALNLVDTFSNFYKQKVHYNLSINNKKEGQVHLDLFYKNNFIYKFDIYSEKFKSENFNGNFIPEVIQSGNTKNFFFISKHQVQVPNEVMDIIIRIFELDSFPHKRHHKEIIFNYSKKRVFKAFEAISNYSNKSYLHIKNEISND